MEVLKSKTYDSQTDGSLKSENINVNFKTRLNGL
jgi:hypothetical protein